MNQIEINKVKIREFSEDDDLELITNMIRSAYKSLLDIGLRYWGTYQTVEHTKRRLFGGHPYIAELDGEIIGTITLKKDYRGQEETLWYDKSFVCYFTQFAVLPKYQKSGLGSFMMSFVENKAQELGFDEIALDTSEDAKGLISYYKKRGYRFIEHVQWDLSAVNYRSVVLSKKLA